MRRLQADSVTDCVTVDLRSRHRGPWTLPESRFQNPNICGVQHLFRLALVGSNLLPPCGHVHNNSCVACHICAAGSLMANPCALFSVRISPSFTQSAIRPRRFRCIFAGFFHFSNDLCVVGMRCFYHCRAAVFSRWIVFLCDLSPHPHKWRHKCLRLEQCTPHLQTICCLEIPCCLILLTQCQQCAQLQCAFSFFFQFSSRAKILGQIVLWSVWAHPAAVDTAHHYVAAQLADHEVYIFVHFGSLKLRHTFPFGLFRLISW